MRHSECETEKRRRKKKRTTRFIYSYMSPFYSLFFFLFPPSYHAHMCMNRRSPVVHLSHKWCTHTLYITHTVARLFRFKLPTVFVESIVSRIHWEICCHILWCMQPYVLSIEHSIGKMMTLHRIASTCSFLFHFYSLFLRSSKRNWTRLHKPTIGIDSGIWIVIWNKISW